MKTVLLLIGFIIGSIHFADAQQAKVAKIGWLGAAVSSIGIKVFRRELHELGYLVILKART
jgi:hypothetical protein